MDPPQQRDWNEQALPACLPLSERKQEELWGAETAWVSTMVSPGDLDQLLYLSGLPGPHLSNRVGLRDLRGPFRSRHSGTQEVGPLGGQWAREIKGWLHQRRPPSCLPSGAAPGFLLCTELAVQPWELWRPPPQRRVSSPPPPPVLSQRFEILDSIFLH